MNILKKDQLTSKNLPVVQTDPASSTPSPAEGLPAAMGANNNPLTEPPSPRAGTGDFVPSPLEQSYFSSILDLFF